MSTRSAPTATSCCDIICLLMWGSCYHAILGDLNGSVHIFEVIVLYYQKFPGTEHTEKRVESKTIGWTISTRITS